MFVFEVVGVWVFGLLKRASTIEALEFREGMWGAV